jgi:hypothetical protein
LGSFAETPLPRSLYDGAQVRFERAIFLKPQEAANSAHIVRLAPLVIQEVSSTSTAIKPSQSTFKPTQVFYHPGSIKLGESTHGQMTYWWLYESATATNLISVRLTMSTNGVPKIYEVFESQRRVRQIFVTQSIEAAARDEFGPPLPGRRHSVEPSLRDAPDVVVSRVIEDSPDIMGPFVYLEAESHSVATLICRCSSAQFRNLAGQGLYELVPGDFCGKLSPATRLDAANPRGLPEDFLNSSNRLSRGLRLPRDF